MEQAKQELPLGLGMALARDQAAMDYFVGLTRQEKDQVIAHTRTIRSKQEMRDFVHTLPHQGLQ